jgi:dienelactone hydrolase
VNRKRPASTLLWLLCAIAFAGCGAEQSGPFDYNDGAPLDMRVSSSRFDGGVRITEFTYASPKGGRVPALLFVPSSRGPHAGLILQHGLPGSKDDFASEGKQLARLGAVVIAISAPFDRRGGEPIAFTRRDSAEQIQLIVDLRRAVDLLRARADIDDDRIAYLGVSYGAAMGGLLAGADHRIAAFVLMSGDGGLVHHFGGSVLSSARPNAWLAAMLPIEPLTWVKRASAPILLLSGRRDHLVPPREAARYQRAAPQPKQIRWYDSDHFLPPRAWCDAAHFLGKYIGIAGSRHPACGH